MIKWAHDVRQTDPNAGKAHVTHEIIRQAVKKPPRIQDDVCRHGRPEFDSLYEEAAKEYPKADRRRLLSARKDRERDAGAGRPPALCLREGILPSLSCYRTYVTQDVVASVVLGIGQASASRTMDRIAPVLRQQIGRASCRERV